MFETIRRPLVAFFVAAGALALAACASDLSPRETSLNLMTWYLPIQTTAETLVTSGLLDGKPDLKRSIQTASRTATDAVLAYDDATRGCLRDVQTGDIVLVEGFQCEPSKAKRLLPVAKAAATSLATQLAQAQ